MKTKKAVKKRKKPAPSLPSLKKKAWGLLSKCIRLESADTAGMVECYTCGVRIPWTQAQAGHAIGGRHGSVLFRENIIRCQCLRDNIYGRGEYGIFAHRLIEEHGSAWYQAELDNSRLEKKWIRPELECLISAYKQRLASLDMGL